MRSAPLVRLYYLATPLFAALDLLVGVSVRAAGIASLPWRFVYYAFSFACWVLIRRRPAWLPAIGITEGSVNLLLLFLSVLGPIFAAPAIVAEGGTPDVAFGLGKLVNLLLAGSVLILGIQSHQATLARRMGIGTARATGESSGPDVP
jgi:hypothetical protein